MSEIDLSSYKEDRVERLGLHIKLADGSRVSVLPIDLWTPEQRKAYREAAYQNEDYSAGLKIALGDEQAERFLADPHGDVTVFAALVEEWAGGNLPES